MAREWTAADARTEPVDAERCLWCKHPASDDALPVGEDERLCRECAGDLREFKRNRFVDFLVASSLRSSTQQALLESWSDVQATLVEWHRDDPTLNMLPARESHAHDGPQSDE